MGPSGAGKSTLLALMAGFIEPSSTSDIVVCWSSLLVGKAPHTSDRLAMLYSKNIILFAHLTCEREHIGLGLHPGLEAQSNTAVNSKLQQAAQQVGVGSAILIDCQSILSGGQRQRVALGALFCSTTFDLVTR